MDYPPCGDFGWQMNNALNRIANYAKKNGLSAADVVTMFDTAIAVRSVFLARQSVDSSAKIEA
jgi:hypothetical protein